MMTTDEKIKRIGWILFTRLVAIISCFAFLLLAIIIAENHITSTHWIMMWGFFAISASNKAYQIVVESSKPFNTPQDITKR